MVTWQWFPLPSIKTHIPSTLSSIVEQEQQQPKKTDQLQSKEKLLKLLVKYPFKMLQIEHTSKKKAALNF